MENLPMPPPLPRKGAEREEMTLPEWMEPRRLVPDRCGWSRARDTAALRLLAGAEG